MDALIQQRDDMATMTAAGFVLETSAARDYTPGESRGIKAVASGNTDAYWMVLRAWGFELSADGSWVNMTAVHMSYGDLYRALCEV